jgi:hypothetical protein
VHGAINTEELEQQIKDELSSQTGVTPTSVDCPQNVPAEEGKVRWEVTTVE